MARIALLTYGLACYAVFLAAFLYLVGFLANFAVPKGIDDGTPAGTALALVVNVALVLLFAAQHSVMARPAFKRWWTRVVPGAAERSTYVLLTSVVLIVIYALWQPMPGDVWRAEAGWLRTLLWCAYGAGLMLALLSTFMVDHFDLLGLRQVWLAFRGRAYTPTPFKVSWLYRYVRHPLYTGFFLAFWATPDMSVGHALFAGGMTVYVLVAVRYEERDLVDALGPDYARYQREVPMFFPRPGRADAATPPAVTRDS